MKRLTVCLLLVVSGCQAQPQGYLDIIPVFWKNLYPQGGESLYCGETFRPHDRRYNIEHVFPMAWVAKSLRCGSRERCREHSERFNLIESDMHNMYPARRDMNQQRGAMKYGLIDGERWVEAGCDLEVDRRRRAVEPRPAIRGDIARAMLYMDDTYPELRLYKRQRILLERWHREDPPDEQELRRNRQIRNIQGNGNTWIK